MFGIPINDYVISSRASLDDIADVIGPLEVVVPNDELEALGFRAGETALIDASNLETFVRPCNIPGNFSGAGRMERQQVYVNGVMKRITTLLGEPLSSAWEDLKKAEDSVMTDITRSRYLSLINTFKSTSYSEGNYYIPEGEYSTASQYAEFQPDMEKLRAKVVELFYIER